MPSQLHAYFIHMLSGFLFVFLREHPIGYALIKARYRLPHDPENDLIPDRSFVANGRGPLVRSALHARSGGRGAVGGAERPFHGG